MLVQQKGNDYPISYLLKPKRMPIALSYPLIFDGSGSIITFDLLQEVQTEQIDLIQSVYIDNNANAGAFTLLWSALGTGIKVKPNTQGFFPVLAGFYGNMTAITPTLNITIPLIFLNVPVPTATWQTQ